MFTHSSIFEPNGKAWLFDIIIFVVTVDCSISVCIQDFDATLYENLTSTGDYLTEISLLMPSTQGPG